MRLVLIPSPFLGPNSWRAVAAHLDGAWAIDYGGVSAPDWYDGVAARIVAQADDEPWVAILHSSAGAFAPSLAAAATQLQGLVFVDAVLPHPGLSAAAVAPAAQIDQLRTITSAGLLARWDQWFPRSVLENWVPDEQARTVLLADIPRVPFSFLEADTPIDAQWEALPSTYLRLSSGFERQATRAEELGWTVRRLNTNHLLMVSDPGKVAAVLSDLD